VEGKAFPRQHYSVFIGDNKAGEVTSGTFSPVLKKGIGLAYIPSKYANIGQELSVLIRDKKIPGKVVETPFVKK